jgi:hypothetical protein
MNSDPCGKLPLDFNPVYVSYARFHGHDPNGMLERDRLRWPGGIMCGFLLWNTRMVHRFLAEHNEPAIPFVKGQYESYRKWLEEEVSVTLSG